MRALAVASAALAGVATWAEWMHVRASRRLLGTPHPAPPRRHAVVVLGYGNRGDRANALNRYRVRVGLRSFDVRAREHVLILSGGPVAGPHAEADLMAAYARDRGFTGEVRVETDSRSTWENVRNLAPLLADADAISFASNALHAEKARMFLWHLHPDLARRLRRADDARVGEVTWLKPLAAVVGAIDLARTRRRLARF